MVLVQFPLYRHCVQGVLSFRWPESAALRQDATISHAERTTAAYDIEYDNNTIII